jgi:hypothetical protein
MAVSSIVIKTGSERENCYRFCRILVDIGNKIARDYVEKLIIFNFGYNDINHFFQTNEKLILEFPDQCGYNQQGKLINKNNYLDGVIRIMKNKQFKKTLDQFDVGACTSIIQNMFASECFGKPSKYLSYFNKHTKKFNLSFNCNHSLYKLRELRNEYFGHIFVFKMRENEFREPINMEYSMILITTMIVSGLK